LLFLSALENKNIMAVGSSNCWYCALQHKPSVLGHPSVEIALRHQLLQPPILRLELPQALDIARLQATEALAPGIDRPFADAVPLGNRRCNGLSRRGELVANHLSDAGFGPSYVSLRTLPGRNLRAETCSDVGCRLVIRIAFHPGARNC
jgi:hypothetical protein